ncbi:hypothetical protein HA49_15795 [Tatumella morbirosei]|uniref:Uncharacterized protein n=1 Tax=Tatumella morbirosei TaxID=642227 RepID=A0A095T6P7_9GAMM|nr:hypothetical protein [Tatumella morbirosei]KGD72214.1 hypothetical protein HA49_15795 [Tatumella morbirosei]
MNEFLQWVKNIRESIGETLLVSMGAAIGSVISWIYTKVRYRRERQFATASSKTKCEVFYQIGRLESSDPNPQAENIINTLLQGIGIMIPWRWSQYVLYYAREKGVAENNIELNAFLKSPQQMNIDQDEFSWNESEYWSCIVRVWVVMLIFSAVLLSISLKALNLATKSNDAQYTPLLFIAFISFVCWFILFLGSVMQDSRLRNAKRFNAQFSPWLEQKLCQKQSTM